MAAGKGRWGQVDKRGQGELESEVLAALWAEDRPLTAGEVQAALGDGLAYNTVLTTLSRMLDKGLVEREKSGRAHAYRPTRGQAALTAQRMHAHLAHLGPGADHGAVLAQFLSTLDDTDAGVLRQLVVDQARGAEAARAGSGQGEAGGVDPAGGVDRPGGADFPGGAGQVRDGEV